MRDELEKSRHTQRYEPASIPAIISIPEQTPSIDTNIHFTKTKSRGIKDKLEQRI